MRCRPPAADLIDLSTLRPVTDPEPIETEKISGTTWLLALKAPRSQLPCSRGFKSQLA